MVIKPNLYKGDSKIIEQPREAVGHKYLGDISGFTPGETYTFSCKMKQIPGESVQATNNVHITQGHNKAYKSYGQYYVKDISNGTLQFTFDYIEGANSILCYTAQTKDGNNMGAEWSEIEIVEGDTRNPVYVPNENTIDPSKQAVFKAGGVFQEVYPL